MPSTQRTTALLHELEAFQRRLIDEAFSGMAEDPVYWDEALEIADEFAPSDWEALEPLKAPPPSAPAATAPLPPG